ncbi:MAG: imidazolonepropionase [Vicinamibacterales bacterium]|nr:imidazolonepropionase [Vicinamibacterales bacterium]
MPDALLIRDAKTVFTCAGPVPRRGRDQADARPLSNVSILAVDGTIVYVGRAADAMRDLPPGTVVHELDASGRTVVPGFVDPHTHVIFGGDRREELRRRLAGATYAEIAADGGGILSTVRDTRAATEDELAGATRARLDDMLRAGTTTAEAKSGYGLDCESELKMLRVIRRLDREHPIDLVPTFMGAHEIPAEHRANRRVYIDQVVRQMMPAVAGDGLAEWCDVFCEDGVYTPEETIEILEAGKRHGLKARVHADELAESGGSLVAARVGARSADHLLYTGPRGIEAMRDAGVVATFLPVAAFYLKIGRYAPAREFIAAGVPVALATDLNPGGGFSPSMPFAMSLACFAMRMTMEEALVAGTINAAYAVDRHDRVGSLEPGKRLDAVILDGDAVDLLKVGVPAIRTVVKNGVVVATPASART